MKVNKEETLNVEIDFKVYSNRWNQYDLYKIKRTSEGWEVSEKSEYQKANKDGEGALFKLLDDNEIFYPKDGVSFALEKLWRQADEGEINLKELKFGIYDIAVWISYMERNLRKQQPSWCKFY
ncbi:MAG: hypothetical protein ACRCTZ_14800 [Sarcina sp.]